MSEKTKIRSICVDTLTGIMNEMYMQSVTKPSHEKWRDWGQDIWKFNSDLQDLGFSTILIIGEPGKIFFVSLLNEIQNLLYSRQRTMFS